MLRDERDETVRRYSTNRMNGETDDNLLRVRSFTAAVNQCCRWPTFLAFCFPLMASSVSVIGSFITAVDSCQPIRIIGPINKTTWPLKMFTNWSNQWILSFFWALSIFPWAARVPFTWFVSCHPLISAVHFSFNFCCLFFHILWLKDGISQWIVTFVTVPLTWVNTENSPPQSSYPGDQSLR